MKSFLMYKEKNVKVFKRLITSGGSLFDKYKNQAVGYIKYLNSDFDSNMALYKEKCAGIDSVELERVFPTKFKWMARDTELKAFTSFMKDLESRISEFETKENALKVLVGVSFLRFLITCKLVDTFGGAASMLVSNGVALEDIDMTSLGLGNSVLKYFNDLEELGSKTIDEWLEYSCDDVELKYFQTAMKRITAILIGDERGSV